MHAIALPLDAYANARFGEPAWDKSMIQLQPPFRPATPADAAALTDLVHFASEGLALHVWTRIAGPDGDAWQIGRERARRETGSFSYRNAVVIEEPAGQVTAALIGYALPDAPQPISQDMPPMFVPLQELENLAPGTWYVNVLAAYPEHRGKGQGRALLGIADRIAASETRRGLSIIVCDANSGALRLYQRCGYREQARRKKVKEDWVAPGTDWVLMVKSA
jgi:ribosomal protein S18 acetylase RimI-like enzyme